MATPTDIVQSLYAAFGRGDIQGVLAHVDDSVDWEFVGPQALPYSGRRSTRADVGEFFAKVVEADDIHVFEPREFLSGGDHVTVLGWERSTARETSRPFETEWIHVFSVRNGKVVRWRGFYNTAARYVN